MRYGYQYVLVQVLPVYCFDPRHFGTTPFGSPKTGKYRSKFILECVMDLKQQLRCVPCRGNKIAAFM